MRTTLLVRKIMQIHGKERIFTNQYENSRSVKCYTCGPEDAQLVESIITHLDKAGVKFTIKRTDGTRYGGPGLIVGLPL